MSDNTLLVLGTFSLNLAILGGATYYLYSDYRSRIDDENAVVASLTTSQATLTDSVLSLNTSTTKNASGLSSTTSALSSLSNVVSSNVGAPVVNFNTLSNLTVGNDPANALTIQGYSGNSRILFGDVLTIKQDGTTSTINSGKDLNIMGGANMYFSTSLKNVGVNNTSPQYPFDVTGDINTSTNINGTKLCLTNTPTPTCVSGSQLASLIGLLSAPATPAPAPATPAPAPATPATK
jgi:hypothetical protein